MTNNHVHVTKTEMQQYVHYYLADGNDTPLDCTILARICECCEHGDVCYKLMRECIDEYKVARN